MNKEDFDLMEVKPKNKGWYFVSLFQFEKEKSEHPDYIKDWLGFNGENWDYQDMSGRFYVCFIHKKEVVKNESQ